MNAMGVRGVSQRPSGQSVLMPYTAYGHLPDPQGAHGARTSASPRVTERGSALWGLMEGRHSHRLLLVPCLFGHFGFLALVEELGYPLYFPDPPSSPQVPPPLQPRSVADYKTSLYIDPPLPQSTRGTVACQRQDFCFPVQVGLRCKVSCPEYTRLPRTPLTKSLLMILLIELNDHDHCSKRTALLQYSKIKDNPFPNFPVYLCESHLSI